MRPLLVHPSWFLILAIVALVLVPFSNFWLTPALMQCWWVLIAAVHVIFAVGIARDAAQRYDRNELLFVDSLSWGLAVLVFGLAAIALYWLMHYSRLKGE